MVSAGFDAGARDPVGECLVTSEGFAQMTHMLKSLANGKVVMVLEGGYNSRTVSDAVHKCTKALLGDPLDAIKCKFTSEGTPQLVEKVRRIVSPYYMCMQAANAIEGLYLTNNRICNSAARVD
jgi:histone deacetylase 6